MKFGNYLKSATVPEWAPKYLDYHVCVCTYCSVWEYVCHRCVCAHVYMCVYMCVFGGRAHVLRLKGGENRRGERKEATMKFGNHPKSATVPERAPKYLDYHVCVKLLKTLLCEGMCV